MNKIEQFVIFKLLSYCFEKTVGLDVKASFVSRPVSRLISWYSSQVIKQNNFDKKLFSSTRLFMDWKLQTAKKDLILPSSNLIAYQIEAQTNFFPEAVFLLLSTTVWTLKHFGNNLKISGWDKSNVIIP